MVVEINFFANRSLRVSRAKESYTNPGAVNSVQHTGADLGKVHT
ncbi:hypothetical protein [Amycolatopsis sp. cmx-11-32]